MLVPSMTAWRDDRFAALIKDEIVQAVGVIGAISQDLICRQSPNEIASRRHVVLLPRPQSKAHRQPERIDYGVDLGAEPASGAAESLGLRSPLFRRPPAACA